MGTIDNKNQRVPRIPGQQADIAVGSPLAIVGLFTEIVRERFRPGNGLAWAWDENATPKKTEENTEDQPRRIVIEPAFSETSEIRNFRPAIYVDKGETAAGKVVIGNFVGQHLPTGFKAFYALGTVPMDIEVVSDNKGESGLIADITWFYILAGRDLIRSSFGIHELTPPILGRTVPFEGDKGQWSTHITFEVQFDLRWDYLARGTVAQRNHHSVSRFERAESRHLLPEAVHQVVCFQGSAHLYLRERRLSTQETFQWRQPGL
jgi:hypothetical protein